MSGRLGLKVLIVDDNRDAANSLETIVKACGHETRVAYDGDVEDIIRQFHPDTFLLDIGLPKRDGLDLAALVRTWDGFEDSLIITITGYHDQHLKTTAKFVGVDHFFTKPVDPMAIVQLLEERRLWKATENN